MRYTDIKEQFDLHTQSGKVDEKVLKTKFKKVQFFKPESSRGESKETYLHCAILNTL